MTDDRIREIADGLLLHADAGLIAFADAIRREALEEAAQRVMKILGYPPSEYYAEAIRALSKKKSGE